MNQTVEIAAEEVATNPVLAYYLLSRAWYHQMRIGDWDCVHWLAEHVDANVNELTVDELKAINAVKEWISEKDYLR